jgi:hypothetical protein
LLDVFFDPCFFSDHLVSGDSGAKLCYMLSSCNMSFPLHGEVKGGEWHVNRDMKTSNGGMNQCSDEELAWCFGIRGKGMQVGLQYR